MFLALLVVCSGAVQRRRVSALSCLPNELEMEAGSFLSTKEVYMCFIRNFRFSGLLTRIADFAILASEDDAIEFFWKFNREISEKLTNLSIQDCVGAATSSRHLSDRAEWGLTELRTVALGYLRLRTDLLSSIHSHYGSLSIVASHGDRLTRSIGLLASSRRLRILDLSRVVMDDLRPLSRFVHLKELLLPFRPIDTSPIQDLISAGLTVW